MNPRMNTILQIIRKCGDSGAIKKQLIAQCCLNWDKCHKTVSQLVNTLINANLIFEKEGMLYECLQEGSEEGIQDNQGLES